MRPFLRFTIFSTLALCALSLYAPALGTAAEVTQPARITVTHEPKRKDSQLPPLTEADLDLEQGSFQPHVTELQPGAKDGSDLQLLVLIDDGARDDFGTQINDIKAFIESLPRGTQVGLGYMRNGTNEVASPFTRDHRAAAEKVRLPISFPGASVSPYESLADAVHNWTGTFKAAAQPAERREVILISNGVEGLGGGYTSDNPYVNHGIDEALRGGVVVYTISYPSGFRSGRNYWRGTWGQNFLSQLADETGAEAYNINMGVPVALKPYFQEISQQLQEQYLLTFDAKAGNKAELERIRLRLKEKEGNIAYPHRVLVKAGT